MSIPPSRGRSALVGLLLTAWAAAPVVGQDSEAPTDRLRTSLKAAVEGYGWGSPDWGVAVRSLDREETLFELNPTEVLAPASNVKLLTSAAALAVLGPDYRFRTYVLTDAPIRDGVVHGDLVLYGTGDPGIGDRFYRRKDTVLQRLIDQIEEAGIHTVTGDVVADASFFSGPLRHEEWDPRDLNDHFTAAVSAISFNENVVSFRLTPDSIGRPPAVLTVPAPSGLDVFNEATTVAGRARPRVAIVRDAPLDPVRIQGRMPSNSREVWRQITVSVPARFAAEAFREALARRGLVVVGGTRWVSAPARSISRPLAAPAAGRPGPRVLATHVSPPLSEYLEVVNKRSNNLFAELIFRAVGRAVSGVATFEASAVAVKATLAGLGVDTVGMVLRDGSGLAGGNRVSAHQFVQTIDAMAHGDAWPEYWASLPQAGTWRELGRMHRTAAAGNLRAKTGTIERVSALSGMVRSRDGERLAFSIIVNDARSQSRAKRVENQIGIRLASFERAPGSSPPVTVADAEPTPRPTGRHRVRRGENLSVIALRYGVTVGDLLDANPAIEPNRIAAGDWIDLPRADLGQRAGGS